MNEDIFSKGIGNKPAKKALEAKPVVVQDLQIEPVFKKGTTPEEKTSGKAKEVGRKLVVICKHPDKDEPIRISEMVLRVGNTIKASTIWVNLDEDKNIEQGSHIAKLLEIYQVKSLNELENKPVNTELDENKFLAIKAY